MLKKDIEEEYKNLKFWFVVVFGYLASDNLTFVREKKKLAIELWNAAKIIVCMSLCDCQSRWFEEWMNEQKNPEICG